MSVRTFLLPAALAGTVLAAPPAGASWDAAARARGWAFWDVDGSLTFLEPARQEFLRWDPVQGLLEARPVPALEERRSEAATAESEDPYAAAARLLYGEGKRPALAVQVRKVFPERWILDPRDRAWLAAGRELLSCDRAGKVLSRRALPAPVADLVRVADGFFVGYRTLNPFVQKFDWKGEVVWTYQRKGAVPAETALHRIVGHDGKSVLLAELGGLSFTVLGPGASGQIYFTRGGAVAEPLALGRRGRGPMAYCPARNAVLAVFDQEEARPELAAGKGAAGRGLALACFRLDRGTVEWRSTGLEEGHQLVAVSGQGAVFTAPAGGLVTVPVP